MQQLQLRTFFQLIVATTLVSSDIGNRAVDVKPAWADQISQSRSQALEAVDNAHSEMASASWKWSLGSFGVNAIPTEWAGPAVALTTDTLTVLNWYHSCADEYNKAMDDIHKTIMTVVDETLGYFGAVAGSQIAMRLGFVAVRYLKREAKTLVFNFATERVDTLAEKVTQCSRTVCNKVIDVANQNLLNEGGRTARWINPGTLVDNKCARYATNITEGANAAHTAIAETVETEARNLLAQDATPRLIRGGFDLIPLIGNAIGGTIGLACMRHTLGTVNDEFQTDYKRAIKVLHDAVLHTVTAQELHDGGVMYLQTFDGKNMGIDSDKKFCQSTNFDRTTLWYIEKRSGSLGDKICHNDHVYLRHDHDEGDMMMGVDKNGQVFMSDDRGDPQTFILMKAFAGEKDDPDDTFDPVVHDTDIIYLASFNGQHHVGRQDENRYTEYIGVDPKGQFYTGQSRSEWEGLMVSTHER